jgi:hypothetical protein
VLLLRWGRWRDGVRSEGARQAAGLLLGLSSEPFVGDASPRRCWWVPCRGRGQGHAGRGPLEALGSSSWGRRLTLDVPSLGWSVVCGLPGCLLGFGGGSAHGTSLHFELGARYLCGGTFMRLGGPGGRQGLVNEVQVVCSRSSPLEGPLLLCLACSGRDAVSY